VTVKKLRYRVIERPLRMTFATALGSKNVLRSVIVDITLSDGTRALGEIPTSHAVKDETINVIVRALKELLPSVAGLTESEYPEKIVTLRQHFPRCPMTIAGVETALFRAFLFSKGVTEYGFWGGTQRFVESDITVPFLRDEHGVGRWVDGALRKGFRYFKVKVSGRLEEDEELLKVFWQSASGRDYDIQLRLDGNQGFTTKDFLSFCDFIMKKGYPVELFEQPLPKGDFRGFKLVNGRTPFPIILDETVFSVGDLKRVLDEGIGYGVNIKIAKSGLAGAQEIFTLARQAGMKIMMGCMMETMVGLSAAIYFAAGKGGIDYIDLDAVHFLHHRRCFDAITIEGPRYHLN
jgi:L-Ala-D/L-Glu epimerase